MDIAAKIEALEIKLAFQDDLVETLNGIVVEQQQQNGTVHGQLQGLLARDGAGQLYIIRKAGRLVGRFHRVIDLPY